MLGGGGGGAGPREQSGRDIFDWWEKRGQKLLLEQGETEKISTLRFLNVKNLSSKRWKPLSKGEGGGKGTGSGPLLFEAIQCQAGFYGWNE